VNVSRRKNDFKVSLAYMWEFLTPVLKEGFGDSIGMTAGSGKDGAGETDLLIDIAGDEAPKDDRLLWLTTLGGFIGSAMDVGVPGQEGPGDPIALFEDSLWSCARKLMSGGAGLFEEIRRPGRSILKLEPTFANFDSTSRLSRVNCPSFVFNE